jgi:SAM-dependent methyltransferase
MTGTSNAEQIEFWNGRAGEKWVSLQDAMDRNMNSIMDALMPFAAAQSGERVLDIGCGCGSTTLALAKSVTSEGMVIGIDVSAPMLELARARVAAGNAAVEFIEADASTRSFEPAFDLVFSRFGVMFFADPIGAFRNIRAALKPGGRVVFVCWRAMAENPWAFVPLEAARELLPPQPPADPHAPGPFAFAERARLESILRNAGFRDIEIEAFDGPMNIGQTIKDASAMMLEIGPLSRAAAELDDDTKARIRVLVAEVITKFATPTGVTPPGASWLVRSRA